MPPTSKNQSGLLKVHVHFDVYHDLFRAIKSIRLVLVQRFNKMQLVAN